MFAFSLYKNMFTQDFNRQKENKEREREMGRHEQFKKRVTLMKLL